MPTPQELRAAQLAHVLARAGRDGEVNSIDAGRILKHELRRLNTNRSHKLEVRSHGAQTSIEKRTPERPPRTDSDDALHADHVYPFTLTLLYEVTTIEGWVRELRRLATVVFVTAKENYGSNRWRSWVCRRPRSTPQPASGHHAGALVATRWSSNRCGLFART
jgi:hypothetical protein